MRFLKRRFAASDKGALAQGERGVQRCQELQEAGGQVAGGIEADRGRIYGHELVGERGRCNGETRFSACCGHQLILAAVSSESFAPVSSDGEAIDRPTLRRPMLISC